jgi:hypothetical protein
VLLWLSAKVPGLRYFLKVQTLFQDKASGQTYILMEARLQELFKKPAEDCTILAKFKAGP